MSYIGDNVYDQADLYPRKYPNILNKLIKNKKIRGNKSKRSIMDELSLL